MNINIVYIGATYEFKIEMEIKQLVRGNVQNFYYAIASFIFQKNKTPSVFDFSLEPR